MLTLALVYRALPVDRRRTNTDPVRFDHGGTLLLAITLVTYALAMTTARTHFGMLSIVLLLGAVLGLGSFVLVEARVASPLFRPAVFRDPVLGAGFVMNALVTTVVMATLVVGPFYLSGAMGLDAAGVGLVMSSGPLVAALVGVPAGRIVDRFGSSRTTLAGLIGMLTGASILTMVPTSFGVPGYIAPLVVFTAGYAVFQAANNTAVLADVAADRRGVVSGLLNLSRNLGLITGASAMGAVFVFGSAAADVATASPEAVTAGLRATFVVAAVLTSLAFAVALASRARSHSRNAR